MKALLVDDEPHVREAIRLLADWQRFGIDEVLEASDGEAATELIREQSPAIVITDMRMPRKDGKELLTWISDNAPSSKVLVVSGYDEFELVRHAIRSGGTDYILKPVEPDALNEAISRAAAAWCKEEAARSRQISQSIELNRMKPHYTDKLLSDMLAGQADAEELAGKLRQLAASADPPAACRVAVLSLEHCDRELLDKFQSYRQLLVFTLLNISNEVLGHKGAAFRHLGQYGEVVLLYWDGAAPFRTALDQINDGMKMTIGRKLHFGVSEPGSVPEQAGKRYAEASALLWRRNLLPAAGKTDCFIHDGASDYGQLRFPRLAARADKLRLAALSGSREQMAAETEDWLGEMRELPWITPEYVSEWNEEWDWLQKQWELDAAGKPAEAKEEESLEEVSHPLPLDSRGMLDWEQWRAMMVGRLEAASRLLASQPNKDNHIIYDIADYITARYKEELSLQDIASHFFLSREYISRKFKQEFGVTMSDYISRIRMERAKVLLMNGQLRIAQVAEMVGYQDENYFSKVFKKQEGIRPGEYRKQFKPEE
ncbi:response regulator transcription factor [Paenibacillus protaetiae]|uniref:Response regulator n=1 Tax=Paenibacillus protaetiae TaxID=2509456 RepID=A0A4P6EW49_9BACL|nr:response regulator [Paenibacillus protaetiae]QAY67244.1 response regulator [Paenibacillus protaetiae]